MEAILLYMSLNGLPVGLKSPMARSVLRYQIQHAAEQKTMMTQRRCIDGRPLPGP